MTKRAVILTGRLVQDHEYIYPYYRGLEDGYELDVAVPGKEQVLGSIGVKVIPTKDTKDIKVSNYELMILPGGTKCMEYLRQEQHVLDFISNFHAAGKVILSCCHAGQLLISAGLVKGRCISAYYSIKDDINNAGGTYVDAPFVIDVHIVSSPHYKHLGPWMKAGLELTEKNQHGG